VTIRIYRVFASQYEEGSSVEIYHQCDPLMLRHDTEPFTGEHGVFPCMEWSDGWKIREAFIGPETARIQCPRCDLILPHITLGDV
jgi:hypothetical protein